MEKLAEEILDFWSSAGAESWYKESPEFDDEIRKRFKDVWSDALDGKFKEWQLTAHGSLALIILFDQFPRNMFRGSRDSFASDKKALCIAKKALKHNFDLQIEGDLRQFFYLPFMHSESLMDQDASVRAFMTRMSGTSNLLHARAHRKVIRDFGRFPYRNETLGRKTTEKENVYLSAGGYKFTVENMDE